MKVGVIGLGSMGKRRIRLIKSNFPDIEIYGIDTNNERCKEVEELFNINTFQDAKKIFEDNSFDAVFISTSPISHSKLINQALNSNLNVFTEINLVDALYEENTDLAINNDLTLFLSSTQLYRKEIEYISDRIDHDKNKTSYVYHIGNYLPDWHPWENYKDFFVSDKRTNGCREILAIELPWIINAFGRVKELHVNKNKISNLNIDYPDSYIITLEHERGTGVLIVDLVSRNAVRNLEVINEDYYIQWNGMATGLEEYNLNKSELENINLYKKATSQEGYNETIVEEAYLEEIKDFFESIKLNKSNGRYSFKEDKYILSLIDLIENSDNKKVYSFDLNEKI